ncbi:MAG: hypothetical protein ACFCVA_18770, partial [Gammaproteobacteria bacterium]
NPIAALGGARSSPIYLICLVAARRPPGSQAARDGFFTTSQSIALFYGKRKPGQPENPVWRALLNALPALTTWS